MSAREYKYSHAQTYLNPNVLLSCFVEKMRNFIHACKISGVSKTY